MFGESRPESHPVFHKTQMCKFHMLGKCTRKKACKFAHSEDELQPLPDFSRTKLCPELREKGRCEGGAECAFAHTLADLRTRRKGREEQRAQPGRPLPTGPRQRAAPARASRAAEVEAALPSRPQNAEAPLPVVMLAQSMPVQVVQVLQLPCLPLPAAAPGGGCGGAALGEEAARGLAERWEKEPLNSPDVVIGEDFLGGSCDKDEELDLPMVAWSRQSTEEGVSEPAAEFSRESTAEAWEPLSEEWPSEEPRREGAADVDNDVVADAPPAIERWRPSFREVAASLGFELAVKNTFIELSDQEPFHVPLRRARSTGDALALAF